MRLPASPKNKVAVSAFTTTVVDRSLRKVQDVYDFALLTIRIKLLHYNNNKGSGVHDSAGVYI